MLVVHLEDLDVPLVGRQGMRRLFDENTEKIDAEAHIAGLDDPGVTRSS